MEDAENAESSKRRIQVGLRILGIAPRSAINKWDWPTRHAESAKLKPTYTALGKRSATH